jgi:hypothetical protein
MTKIIYRILIFSIILIFSAIIYLSTIGIKTDRFNSKILTQIKKIDKDLIIKLNKVSVTLNLFQLKVNAKTVGADLIYKKKIIQLESINSSISLKSLMNNKFSLIGIDISTKSLNVKNLISFIRVFKNDPKFYIAEQFIKNGYLVADLKIQFDDKGNVKKNYKINGFLQEGRINLLNKYDFNKIDFIFEIKEKYLKFNDIKLFLNKKNILIPELIALKKNKEYSISGKLNNKNTTLTKNEIINLFNNKLTELDIDQISFSSKNNFKFKINKDFKVKKLDIKSDIVLNNLKLKNSLILEDFLPKIKKDFIFENQIIKLEYKKDNLSIIGEGEVFLQNEIDLIEYEFYKRNDQVKFNTTLNISKNPFKLDLLNYKKKENSNLKLKIQGKRSIEKKLIFDEISFKEKNNIVSVKDLTLSGDYKIDDIGNIDINYVDEDNFKNNLKITKKNKDYLVSGNSFNIDKIIEKLLNSENENKSEFFNKNSKFIFDIRKINLDKDNYTNDLKGFLSFNKSFISELNLEAKFSNKKNIKLTIKDNGEEKITTLFSHEAKPLVKRYKFIKGFDEGDLDFYSIKKNNITNSTLKIDNFKIQEIPVLAKLLTLASLQGIADLLTGEGIRFTDFEMKFSNKDKLMTIEEMYAIGPAISILMDGYIEKNKLISLRGTLVPATTVNRTISSIPLIGSILVGKKVGEGVFGVSFKVKGPPKDLETTVNPIKTLTPRFITRTLEKIKKN